MTLQFVANKTRPEHLLWATDVHTYNTTGKKTNKKKRKDLFSILFIKYVIIIIKRKMEKKRKQSNMWRPRKTQPWRRPGKDRENSFHVGGRRPICVDNNSGDICPAVIYLKVMSIHGQITTTKLIGILEKRNTFMV